MLACKCKAFIFPGSGSTYQVLMFIRSFFKTHSVKFDIRSILVPVLLQLLHSTRENSTSVLTVLPIIKRRPCFIPALISYMITLKEMSTSIKHHGIFQAMDLLLQAPAQFSSYTVVNKICSLSLVKKYLTVAFFFGVRWMK